MPQPQVNDIATVIPRNSVIEANQSGLIAEPLIDITPQLPLPTYTCAHAPYTQRLLVGALTCAHPCMLLLLLPPSVVTGVCVCPAAHHSPRRPSCAPRLALPTHTHSASPLDKGACEEEAAIVCHTGTIKGQQGVALDDMVYVMTRMARQMEEVRLRVQSVMRVHVCVWPCMCAVGCQRLCCAVLCCAVLCCAVLCCAVLCCGVL
jgi:hypothetical protein